MSYYTQSVVAKHLVLCFLLAMVSAVVSPVGRGQSAATLTGEVADVRGRKIMDTNVSLYSPDRILRTTSDRMGHFEFANVPPGTYELLAEHPPWKRKSIEAIRITDNAREQLSIIMDIGNPGCVSADSIAYEEDHTRSGRTLNGLVLGLKGRRLPRANVQLLKVGTQVLAQRSTVKGRFLFADLEPGRYMLKVSHVGYYDERTEDFWITRENQTHIVVEMLKHGLLRVCG